MRFKAPFRIGKTMQNRSALILSTSEKFNPHCGWILLPKIQSRLQSLLRSQMFLDLVSTMFQEAMSFDYKWVLGDTELLAIEGEAGVLINGTVALFPIVDDFEISVDMQTVLL